MINLYKNGKNLCEDCAARLGLNEGDLLEDQPPYDPAIQCDGCGKLQCYTWGVETAYGGEGGVLGTQVLAFAQYYAYLINVFGRPDQECALAQRALTVAILADRGQMQEEINAMGESGTIDLLDDTEFPSQFMTGHQLHDLAHHLFTIGWLFGKADHEAEQGTVEEDELMAIITSPEGAEIMLAIEQALEGAMTEAEEDADPDEETEWIEEILDEDEESPEDPFDDFINNELFDEK
jgi:hypothetical protein